MDRNLAAFHSLVCALRWLAAGLSMVILFGSFVGVEVLGRGEGDALELVAGGEGELEIRGFKVSVVPVGSPYGGGGKSRNLGGGRFLVAGF